MAQDCLRKINEQQASKAQRAARPSVPKIRLDHTSHSSYRSYSTGPCPNQAAQVLYRPGLALGHSSTKRKNPHFLRGSGFGIRGCDAELQEMRNCREKPGILSTVIIGRRVYLRSSWELCARSAPDQPTTSTRRHKNPPHFLRDSREGGELKEQQAS